MQKQYVKYLIIGIQLIIFMFGIILTHKHKNVSKRQLDCKYYGVIITNLCVLNLLIFVLFDTIISIISFSGNIGIILLHLIVIMLIYDTWLYWIHRSVLHRMPWVRKQIHTVHHDAVVVPSDWLHTNIFEILLQGIGVLIPIGMFYMLGFKFNAWSFIIFTICKLLLEIYLHCDFKDGDFYFPHTVLVSSEFHARHHRVGGGNYSQMFTFWDYLMGTVITKD